MSLRMSLAELARLNDLSPQALCRPRKSGLSLLEAALLSEAQLRRLQSKHGKSGSLIYAVWQQMKDRCYNPKNKNYARYGGRGISVCARWWLFDNFMDDMKERPSGASLERIDNDGPYDPTNCKWATMVEQARNRAGLSLLTCRGRTMCLTDWASEIGVSTTTLHSRIKRYGWSVDDAINAGATDCRRAKADATSVSHKQ